MDWLPEKMKGIADNLLDNPWEASGCGRKPKPGGSWRRRCGQDRDFLFEKGLAAACLHTDRNESVHRKKMMMQEKKLSILERCPVIREVEWGERRSWIGP